MKKIIYTCYIHSFTLNELDDISNLLLKGELVPFVGAGISRNTGAVTLDVLTQKLANDLRG